MFTIESIRWQNIHFTRNPKHTNTFVFLTGDNGTGKTTFLLKLARGLQKRDYKKQDMEFRFTGKPSKVITYSMAPFNKFDELKFTTKDDITLEQVGFSFSSSKYALLFQALIEFSRADVHKMALFQEISMITKVGLSFSVRLKINTSKVKDFEGSLRQSDSVDDFSTLLEQEIFKRLLKENHFTLSLSPGKIDVVDLFSEDLNRVASHEHFNKSLLNVILQIRKMGGLVIQDINIKKENTWVAASNLSSGQIALFIGLIILANKIEDNSMILIDEPEISLHPAWQRKFHEILSKISKSNRNCYFFIATHSPIIISEVDPETCSIFNMTQDTITEEAQDILADSRNIEEVYATYFNMITPDNFFVKTIIIKAVQAYEEKNAVRFAILKSYLDGIVSKLDKETQSIIREISKKHLEQR